MKIKYFRSPSVFYHYIKKYYNLKSKNINYLVLKVLKYDKHEKMMAKVLKHIGVTSKEELYKKYIDEKNTVFISSDIDKVITEIRDDNEFYKAIINEADMVLLNTFKVLGINRYDMYDHEIKHYKWFTDFNTGYKFKITHYSRTRVKNNIKGVDIKNIWEVARLQYLFSTALAYRLTSDEKYAIKVIDIIIDFIDLNPMGEGPNWNVSMEVGIRLANIILALELIEKSSHINSSLIHSIVCSTYEHITHIRENEEKVGDRTSNHFLGGLLGILAGSAKFPFLDHGKILFKISTESLMREIDHQILEDGGDFEGSTSYQRLVGELLLFSSVIIRKSGYEFDAIALDKLNKMAEFTYDIMKPNLRVPQIGDNDSGRVFQLLEEDSNDHRSFINLAGWFCNGVKRYANLNDGFKCITGANELKDKNQFFNKIIALKNDSRIVVFKSNKTYLLFSAIDSTRFHMGGHTHNDLLSFELNIDGKDFIVDSGTGEYTGDPNARNYFRSTKAHSTIMINDSEQKQLEPSRLFDLVLDGKTSVNVSEKKDCYIIKGTHTGYLHRFAAVHDRVVTCWKSGNKILLNDYISGEALKILFILPLAPEVHIERINDFELALVNGDITINIKSSLTIEIIDTKYSPRYGVILSNKTLISQTRSISDFKSEVLIRIKQN